MNTRAAILALGLMLSGSAITAFPAHAQLFGESDEEKAARQAHEDGQDAQIKQLGDRIQQLEDKARNLTESLSTLTGANEELAHQIQGGADGQAPTGIAGATQLHGKAMSYNNYVDAAAAWRAAFDFVQPCVAIIKHSNPCGIALGTDLAEAHRKANACDPQSAFGGVIAANGVVTADLADQVKDIFTEIVIAPGFEDAALDILSASKNLRLLACVPPVRGSHAPEWRQVDGGLLLQTPDEIDAPGDDPASWELKTGQPASADVLTVRVRGTEARRRVQHDGQVPVGRKLFPDTDFGISDSEHIDQQDARDVVAEALQGGTGRGHARLPRFRVNIDEPRAVSGP